MGQFTQQVAKREHNEGVYPIPKSIDWSRIFCQFSKFHRYVQIFTHWSPCSIVLSCPRGDTSFHRYGKSRQSLLLQCA